MTDTNSNTSEDILRTSQTDQGEHLFFEKELKAALSLRETCVDDISAKKVHLGPKTKKHTLVLDIDNTLVIAKLVEKDYGTDGNVNRKQSLEIKLRPYVHHLLREMSKLYEIVLFTAGSEEYASQIRRSLDPNGKYIAAALGSSFCTITEEGYHIKDLRIFADRDIKNMVMVDDRITSFAYQINNGIPVVPFMGNDNDRELQLLINYLAELYSTDDIPAFNQRRLNIVNC